MSRPEHLAPPEIFYNDDEAQKYTQNSRMINIQLEMAERCLELLMLPEDETCLLLDLGCGSGLSGSVAEDSGHVWFGMDISEPMLKVAKEREVEGDLLLGDIGNGVPFQPGTFDGAYSVSTLQWLCNADKSSHNPTKRLYTLFSSLLACLGRNARAVFQFYPENVHQTDLVVAQARKAGFFGGLLVDFPDSTKAKKYFLVLMTGGTTPMPAALGTENSQINYTLKREKMTKGRASKLVKKSREWILEKKERRRRQGKSTREDTKYTGRSRSGRF